MNTTGDSTNSQYEANLLGILEHLIDEGHVKGDRTGTGTRSLLGNTLRVDISDNKAPLLYSRKIYPKSFIVENIWFLSGSTDVAFLKTHGVGIWDEWVIDNTAKFRPYTDQEYAKAFETTYPQQEVVPGLVVMNYKDMFNWFRCTFPSTYQKWRKAASPNPTVQELKTFLDDNGISTIPNVKLVSGSIGDGAYGSLWRKWEDTRIVLKTEADKYYKRGYSYVTDVPLAANYKRTPTEHHEHVVVHRNIDQIKNAIELLKNNPESRRIIVTAWNPGRIEDAVLPPCHSLFSFFVRNLTLQEIVDKFDEFVMNAWIAYRTEHCNDIYLIDPEGEQMIQHLKDFCNIHRVRDIHTQALSCLLYMRSSDTVLGTSSNIPQYALLTQMIAQCVGMATDELVYIGADSHIYANHIETTREQLKLDYDKTQQPRFLLDPSIRDIDDFTVDSIRVVEYTTHNSPLKFPIAV